MVVEAGTSGAGSAVKRAATAAIGLTARLRVERLVGGTALVAAPVLILVETPIAAALHDIPVAVALALAVVHAGSLPLALRRPRTGAILAFAAAIGLQGLDMERGAIWPWWPVLIVTQSLVLAVFAAQVRWPEIVLHWLGALTVSAVAAALLRPEAGNGAAVNITIFGAVTAAVLGLSHLATQWRRIRTELLHEREVSAEETARRRLMEERTRIARELHDVIAHSMSIITVQSSTARFRHPEFDDEAVSEFDRIGALSRQALDEMRGLLRVLRGADDRPELRPQPGFGDVPELVARAVQAGTRVRYEPVGDPTVGVGEITGSAAYRIAQEAISNAIRHAPGSSVHVAAELVGESLIIDVANTASPGHPLDPTGVPGHGLIGMAERAATVGGSVRFGPTGDGGYAVHAVLPRSVAVRQETS